MCGIVGMVSNSGMKLYIQKKSWIRTALYLDTLRGEHSTGIYLGGNKSPDKEILYKKVMPGWDFILMSPTIDKLNELDSHNVIIGHNRYATTGKVDVHSAHPYEEGCIRLVHNGTVSPGNNLPVRQTDSASICAELSRSSIKQVLENLYGAFALVWYDTSKEQTFFARNKERPLCYATAEQGSVFLFASEAWTLRIAAEKSNLDLDSNKQNHSIFDFDVNKYYSLDPNLDDYRNKLKNNKFKAKHPPKAIVPYYGTTGGVSNSQKTSEEFLNKHGFKVDQTIQFIVTDNHYKGDLKGNKRYTIDGVVDSLKEKDDIVDVICYWTTLPEEDQWAGQGEVAAVRQKNGKDDPKLILKNVKFLSDYEAPKISYFDYDDIDLYKAYDNKFVFLGEFEKFVENGCANCTSPISPDDDLSIGWTNDNEPVCFDCTFILSNSNVMKEFPKLSS